MKATFFAIGALFAVAFAQDTGTSTTNTNTYYSSLKILLTDFFSSRSHRDRDRHHHAHRVRSR